MVSAWVVGVVTLLPFPSLTLGWVSFWPTASQAFVGCEGGLGCPSWFVILFLCRLSFTFSGVGVAWSQVCGPSCDSWVLDSSDARLRRPNTLASGRTLSCCRLGFAWRLWPLGGPGTCCFLWPYLGFFPLASSVGRWLEVVEVYPWWSSLRSFTVEVVTLVLCQVIVGLSSWCCCASGLLGPVVFLIFMFGHHLRSGLCSSSVHDRDVAFPPLVGFAFGSSCGSNTSGVTPSYAYACGLGLPVLSLD